jgi:integrase
MEETADNDRWITRQELADRYGLPVKTPAQWASRGTGPRYAPITLLIATGLARCELLGLRWQDYNGETGLPTVTGKVIRVNGEGIFRLDETKSTAGRRTIPLPQFAIAMLRRRRELPYLGEQAVIFPSTAGTLRDPNNFAKEWRTAREQLGVPGATTHIFRKTLATLIDDEGLSARIGTDHLGHSQVSTTQDRYMSRGRTSTPRWPTSWTEPFRMVTLTAATTTALCER